MGQERCGSHSVRPLWPETVAVAPLAGLWHPA